MNKNDIKSSYAAYLYFIKFLNKFNLLLELGPTDDGLLHLHLEGHGLVLELLGTLATLDTLGVELADATLGQTDELDHLLLHGLGDGSVGALDHGLLGDAELVLLVDVGVLLDRVAVLVSRGVDGGHGGSLGLVLQTFLLLSSDLLHNLLRQRRALAGLGSVGLGEQTA